MGRYVRQFEITITVDDEPVTAVMRHASQEDVLSLNAEDKVALLRTFSARLGDAIIELRGPVDAAGVQVPKAEFLSVAYFASAVMEIGSKWVERATPKNPSSPGA